MKANDFYLKEISKIPLLTVEEERKLIAEAHKGSKKAQDKLVTANLRFVVSVAARYQGLGLDMDDLITEGNAGLIKAATRVDPSKKTRFTTYAVWWIRESILKALNETGTMIRFPKNRMEEARSEEWRVSSLDVKTNEEEKSGTLADFIEDKMNLGPEEEFLAKERRVILHKLLASLSEKELKVLELRFGLKNNEPLSLQETGEILNYTKEGVRQIEKRALAKLCSGDYAA